MIVAIIGGAGRMGIWFTKYFLEHGHRVIISDIRVDKAREIASIMNVGLAESNIEATRKANLVFISTPIDATPKVLVEILPELNEQKTVIEISSLKSRVLPILKMVAERGIKVLSLHPLFGFGAQKLSSEKIALIPVVDLMAEKELAEKIFPETTLIPVDYNIHEKAMALILSLTHFINIVFASVVAEEDIDMLKCLSGTTFTLQFILSEAVMSEDPSLYASLQIDNEYVITYINKMIKRAMELKNIIEGADHGSFIKFYMETRNLLSRDVDFARAYEKMYTALTALRGVNSY
ncbi:MAG: prephenate dehydrogenase/arogenate dehydrogenase family protein [Candidatus Bathyarchaeia archaeon]